MDEKIQQIENLLEQHCKRIQRYDEETFNIGVEMGRLLEKNGIASHRPKVFIEFEEGKNAYDRKAKQIDRADKAVAFIIRNGIAEQVENFGEFSFDSDTYRCDKLDESVVEKFGVQIDRTTQREHGGSFEAEFILSGQVGEVLEKYGVDTWARADVDNTTGDEQETIYSGDDVDKIFGVSLRLNGHHTELNDEQLETLADELEQIVVWFNVSLKQVR